jgi:hypothetical protein
MNAVTSVDMMHIAAAENQVSKMLLIPTLLLHLCGNKLTLDQDHELSISKYNIDISENLYH